jgi:hypothetical protein
MKHLEDMKSNKVRVENEISNIPPEQATQTATMDANSKNDSGDDDEKSDDHDVIVLPNKNTKKVAYWMIIIMIMKVINRTQPIQKHVQK